MIDQDQCTTPSLYRGRWSAAQLGRQTKESHMLIRIVPIALIAMLATVSLCNAQPAPVPTTIDIRTTGESIEVTVPVSNLVLAIPKGSFEVEKSSGNGARASPRYFHLRDKPAGQVVSGWFESSDHAVELKESWTAEMAGLQKVGYGQPLNVEEAQIGEWRTITYDLPIQSGSSTHIRASMIRSGTWIDLHLSVSSGATPDDTRRSVKDLLGSIRVHTK